MGKDLDKSHFSKLVEGMVSGLSSRTHCELAHRFVRESTPKSDVIEDGFWVRINRAAVLLKLFRNVDKLVVVTVLH